MKALLRLVSLFAALWLPSGSQAQNFTNKGREFWVGYGHHQYMEPSCDGNNAASNDMNMVIYLSAEQPAIVTVTLDSSGLFPATWFKRTYTIPANTVISTEPMPKGSTNAAESGSNPNFDARLFDYPTPLGTGGEGVWRKKGIHIESNVPIVAYAHIYGGVSSGATMLLPIETWGYSYTSINSEQRDADRSYSWMYVVAKDNNTRIRITPTALSRRGRPAGTPFTVDLMKGQIYQYVAQSDCNTGNGPELTGTKVKSIVGADGICHPIAVFSGSSRTGGETLTCGTGSGRDNDMQQNFPEHAWGKHYLTAPFSRASSGSNLQPSQFQTSVYKIVLKEPNTQVKKNGAVIAFSGNVYTYSSNTADNIEADKPIMVAQFMSGTGACNGGLGDPEMIYLSPIEQAIKGIGFYRNTKEQINANYLTLVVPTGGLASLRIDNSQIFSHTYAHPNMPGYTVVIKGWAAEQAQCIVRCDSAFNAITYGLGGAESYGFNAGTFLKNLNAQGEIYNNPDPTNSAQPFTCTGTPMQLTAILPYQPTSMNWKLSALGSVVSPNADVMVTNPVALSTLLIGNTTYYRYKLPGTYVFSAAGSYDLPIVNTSTDIDNCSLQEIVQIKVEVKQRPLSDFTFSHSGCRTDSVSFFGPNSSGSVNAIAWNWDFGDTTASVLRNPRKAYDSTGSYEVRLVVTGESGCLSDTTKKIVTIPPSRKASIFSSAASGCVGLSITLTDTTTVTNGTFYWDFGTGTPVTLTANTPQTVTYPAPGTYTVRHVIQPAGNCVSDTVTKTIEVFASPAKPAAPSPITYCQNAAAIPLTAIADAGNTLTWFDNTNLTGGSATAPTPVTTTPGTVYYYVRQTNIQGCPGDTTRIAVIVQPAIASNFITQDQTICAGSVPAIVSGTVPTGGDGTLAYSWELSTDGGATWNAIPGAAATSYAPNALSAGVYQYRRLVASGSCTSVSTPVTITVQTSLSNFDISAGQSICEGTAPVLLVGQQPTGGSGSYTYQWESSPNGSSWTPVGAATARDYQPTILNTTTYFHRITYGGSCPATSSPVTITVNPAPNGFLATPAPGICDNQSGSVVFTPSAGTAPYSIQLLVTRPDGTTVSMTVSSLGSGPSTITAIPANSAAGPYLITLVSVSDNTGCGRSAGLNSAGIEVTARPTVVINPAAAAFCAGGSTVLTAGGAASYNWSPASGLSSASGTTVTANPAATTTYTITGTTNGCTGTATVVVTVNALPPSPVVTTPVSYCQNATATALTAAASPGNTLTWFTTPALTNGSATAPTPSTAAAGSVPYYVTQTNGSGCASPSATIVVNVSPSIGGNTITADQTICSGASAAMLVGAAPTGGNGAFTYQWDMSINGGATWTTINGAIGANYTPVGLVSGAILFRRTVNSGLCGSVSNSITITVQAALTNVEIASAQSICEGTAPAPLTGQAAAGGSGSHAYQWQLSTDASTYTDIPGATAQNYSPGNLLSSTYFKRSVISGACSAQSAPVLITVNPAPNGGITTVSPAICDNQSASVVFTSSAGTAPFAVQLTITAPGGAQTTITQTGLAAGATTIAVIPAGSAPGTYQVALTSLSDNTGCNRTTGLNAVSVTVTEVPTVGVTPTASAICAGESVSLSASGAATYAWTPASTLSAPTGPVVTAKPPSTTTYTVTGTTNGCAATATVTIDVNALPTRPQTAPLIDYCQDAATAALTATSDAGNTLTWFDNTSLSNGTATAPVPSTTVAGTTYYYVRQVNANGCNSDTARITIVVHPNPVVNFSLPGTVCMPGGTAVFTNASSIADASQLSYFWNFGDGSTATGTNPTNAYAASGTYTVSLTATSIAGCSKSLPQTLSSFSDRPSAVFNVDKDTICQGVTSVFSDHSTPAGTITGWNWDFGDGTAPSTSVNPTHTYAVPDTFAVSLVVTNAAGCASAPSVKDVTVYLQPVLDAGPDFMVPEGTLIRFNPTVNDPTLSFSWSPSAGLSDPSALRPTMMVTSNGMYTITATGAWGCFATSTLTVGLLRKIRVPNAFSPNGDGVNDTWEIPNLAEYPRAMVEVFNRYGQRVYTATGYSRPWDGGSSGKPLPVGTYYYVITLNSGLAPISGSVTILK
jgi:gliding motility-associated-like protein